MAAVLAAAGLAAVLTGCTASVGGYVAVAVDEASGDVVLVVRTCESTRRLELEVKTASGGDVIWSASGSTSGRQLVVRVGRAPAGWTTKTDAPVPVTRKVSVSGWTDLDDDDSGGLDLRLTGPAFVSAELPLTAASDPTEVVFERDAETRRGSLAAFTAAAGKQCAE